LNLKIIDNDKKLNNLAIRKLKKNLEIYSYFARIY